jgi:GH25 family lysozyme M1 (1,4-beta-N-acetylmuramidase)
MSVAPAGAMKLVRVYSNDKSGETMFTDEQLTQMGVGGLIIRLGSGRQIHGTGSIGHIRKGDFNDHSFKNHIQQAYRLGLFAIAEFWLGLEADDHFAGSDYETEDNQFVPFAYQLGSMVPGVSYHAISLRLMMENQSGGNAAQKLSTFLAMIEHWSNVKFQQEKDTMKIYPALTKEMWERDAGQIASVLVGRDNMPFILEGQQFHIGFSGYEDIPEPRDAPFYSPGNLSGYTYQKACILHYANVADMELCVAWGDAEHVFEVTGYTPAHYDDGGNSGGSNNNGGDTGVGMTEEELLEQFGALASKLNEMADAVEDISFSVSGIGYIVTQIWNWIKLPWYKRLKGIRRAIMLARDLASFRLAEAQLLPVERQEVKRDHTVTVADKFSHAVSGHVLDGETNIIDISYWQDDALIDYDALAAKIDGVILRAAYGIWADPRFPVHYENFASRGKAIGAYHYVIGGYSAAAQVNALADAVGSRELKIGNWCDVEDIRPETALSQSLVRSYLQRADDVFGYQQDIYSSKYRWQQIMLNSVREAQEGRRLWVAHYTGAQMPLLPSGWSEYFLWQYTSKARFDGYTRGGLDNSRYWGTEKEWYEDVLGIIEEEPTIEGLLKIVAQYGDLLEAHFEVMNETVCEALQGFSSSMELVFKALADALSDFEVK